MSEDAEKPCSKTNNEQGIEDGNDEQENDLQYEPVMSLPVTEIPTLEEDEAVMVNLRAKIYRYDSEETPPEWKERGTGPIKILRHKAKNSVRVVMRRDKTLKLCANHFITPQMDLRPSVSCERAWLYYVKADYIDGTVKSHLLAIKFANIENAQKWKDAFDEAKKIVANSVTATKDLLEEEIKVVNDDALKMNDTLDDEKKNISMDKEETPVVNASTKELSCEVTDKFTSLGIKDNEKKESS